jgi:hypothetical protein
MLIWPKSPFRHHFLGHLGSLREVIASRTCQHMFISAARRHHPGFRSVLSTDKVSPVTAAPDASTNVPHSVAGRVDVIQVRVG